MQDVVSRAREWLDQDPDPETRAELQRLLDDGDTAALADRFGAKLEFGTAGLRGAMGAGPNRMNRVTVMRAAAGLAARLGPGKHVVVGYDARHKSDVFARDTAAVLSGAGLRVSLTGHHWPTPVLAFAVRYLDADAGVMVTASHNPARDNGYKVFWRGGAQITPPLDAEISAAIDAVGRVDALPLGEEWETLNDSDIVEPYLDALAALPVGADRQVRIAYTPLHGVGGVLMNQALVRFGFDAPSVVEAQFAANADFPTVEFPNPEEPGAMDLVLELAEKVGADLALAHDPDADRIAVGIPGPHGWRRLTGDEVGALLAEYVLRRTAGADRVVATTIVSSSLLREIAERYGVRCAETLTGFKWIVRAARPGERLVFGYEEALGYSVGAADGLVVHDKDGIGTALVIAGLVAEARQHGRTLQDLLDEQARAYGLHTTRQFSVRVRDLSRITAALARLRTTPPAALGGRAVESAEDLAAGSAELPPTEGLRYFLSGGARVVVRPSGTEPKLKCYLEVVSAVAGDDVAAARARAEAELDALQADLAAALGLA